MINANEKPWPRPILFEGVILPQHAINIDHLDERFGLSEEAAVWLWRFTICCGVTNEAHCETVSRIALETLQCIEQHRDDMLRQIPSRYRGSFDESILGQWLQTLHTMIQIASKRPKCSWTAPDELA